MRRESTTVKTVTGLDLEAGELEIVENSGLTISATELLTLIKTNQIPLIAPGAWFDDRRLCRYATPGNAAGAAGCPCLVDSPAGRYCSLNGWEAKSPCVFDEPPDAPVWVEIRAHAARWEKVAGGADEV